MTIEFHHEGEFILGHTDLYVDWIMEILNSEDSSHGNLNYIFCDDAYLLVLNQKFLDHDTYTDVITFDYSDDFAVSGDIFISTERVHENASNLNIDFVTELRRVMAHGLLHLLGYNDKDENDVAIMRTKEEEKIEMFHVEQ